MTGGGPGRRRLRRESDGALVDLDERRRVELAELADNVRSGRFFRAERHGDGSDCTVAVLAEVLAAAGGRGMAPGGGLGVLGGQLAGGLAQLGTALLRRSEPPPAPAVPPPPLSSSDQWWLRS